MTSELSNLPIPENESERQQALASYGVLDTLPDDALDNLRKCYKKVGDYKKAEEMKQKLAYLAIYNK